MIIIFSRTKERMHIDVACIFISYNRDFIFISVLFKAL